MNIKPNKISRAGRSDATIALKFRFVEVQKTLTKKSKGDERNEAISLKKKLERKLQFIVIHRYYKWPKVIASLSASKNLKIIDNNSEIY